METKKLSSGYEMPVLGYGTYRTEGESLVKSLKLAIQCGYRHIDTAWIYQNEKTVGATLKEVIEESHGKLKREDFFIVSKLWCTHHSRNAAREGLNESLKNLQLDYLDLFLIHFPMGFKENTGMIPFAKDEEGKPLYSDVSYIETYKALEELSKEGKIRSIGISNFTIEQMQDVLTQCEIKPANLQIEISPYMQSDDLVNFCHNNNISVSAYGIIGAGEASTKPDVPALLQHETLINIGKKYNKSAAQVCLRWGLQRDLIVLVKSVTPSRIIENFQIFDFKLSEADMEAIKGLNHDMRLLYGISIFKEHKYYPFK